MSFATGSLVKARGREWVVLPDSDDAVVVLRPLGGTEDEVTGICLALEKVEPARFSLPDPSQLGDYRSCRLLRDAVRRGPFSIVWTNCSRAATLSARAALDGAEARPDPLAYRGRRGYWKDN